MKEFTLSGYQLTEPAPIGNGVTGSTYLAHTHDDPARKLVVKNYRSSAIEHEQLQQNFVRYNEMPPIDGIANVVDWSFDPHSYYSVVEYLEGQTLDVRPILKEAEAWNVIKQLAKAIGHAHKHNVIHTNLYPGNIHFYENHAGIHIQTTDFGSGLCDNSVQLDYYNSAFFLAPEQLTPQHRDFSLANAKKWDVYSFGVIAYWLLTDHLPRCEDLLVARSQDRLDTEPVSIVELAEAIHNDELRKWERRIGVSERESHWMDLINQCLQLDPANRPLDMREVKNRFLEIETHFEILEIESNIQATISDLESRHSIASKEQRSKLLGARVATTVMALSCMGAAYLIVLFITNALDSKTKIYTLDQKVEDQQQSLTQMDRSINETSLFLKQSRALADDAFYKITQQQGQSLTLTELDQSRRYYSRVLKEVEHKPENIEEYGRALHSLAHIENLLSKKNSAIINFELAIDAFESIDEPTGDILLRLADCHEYVGLLSDEASTKEGFESTAQAIDYFTKGLELRPNDQEVALRLATNSFRYGRYLYDNNEFDEAIRAYANSAGAIVTLRDRGNYTGNTSSLDTVVASLQFHAAEALKEEGRSDDAINTYIAAIESAERLRSLDGYSREISLLMCRSFTSLGDIFSQAETIDRKKRDQVYTEALRLISPIILESPEQAEVSTLYCRIVTRLAELEAQAGNKKDGYQLSLRGIESLIGALEKQPDYLAGYLQLAEARLVHIKFINKDKTFARKIALRGVDTAKHAHNLVAETEIDQDYQYRARVYQQLRQIFDGYGTTLKSLGETKTATECFEYASYQFTSR